MRVLAPIVTYPAPWRRPHYHVLGKCGVAFAVLFARASEGHPLVKQATVADFGRFADHHPHAVVDEHAVADAGTGVDFNACEVRPIWLRHRAASFSGMAVHSRWLIRCRLIAWKPG